MLSIEEIRDELIIDASVQDSEDIDESTVDRYIAEAIGEHNSAYALDGSDLPSREVPLVKLLAWIKLTNLRASVWATKNSLSGGQGYGNDRDTPFNKLTRQAALLRADYDKKCISMGIAPDAGGDSSAIVQGSLSVRDFEYEVRTPFQFDRTKLIAPSLGIIGVVAQTMLSLLWNKSKDETFSSYVVFYKLGASVALYEETNNDSAAGVPRIVDDAIKLYTAGDPDLNSLKVTGLTANTDYTFIVAVSNRQGKWVYSPIYSVKTAA